MHLIPLGRKAQGNLKVELQRRRAGVHALACWRRSGIRCTDRL